MLSGTRFLNDSTYNGSEPNDFVSSEVLQLVYLARKKNTSLILLSLSGFNKVYFQNFKFIYVIFVNLNDFN